MPPLIYSYIIILKDANAYQEANARPVERIIHWLGTLFSPEDAAVGDDSLAIERGRGGSKLSHSHRTQFYFVMQSLTLWREIVGDLARLWITAERDLFDGRNPYRLRNTGQGLNRMQSAPRVQRAMGEILRKVKSEVTQPSTSMVGRGLQAMGFRPSGWVS